MADADYRNITRWLVEQLRAGQSAPALLHSMSERGWARDAAMELIAKAMGERSGAAGASPMPATVVAQPSGHPPVASTAANAPVMPGPLLDGAPMFLDAGDRKVPVLVTLPEPRIVLFGDFLSKNECDRLVEVARPRMQRSLTTDLKTGSDKLDVVRTSRGMFFGRGENPLVTTIEARIARLLAWPIEKGEGLQVLHYRPGDRYEPHYDYFDPSGEASPALLARDDLSASGAALRGQARQCAVLQLRPPASVHENPARRRAGDRRREMGRDQVAAPGCVRVNIDAAGNQRRDGGHDQ